MIVDCRATVQVEAGVHEDGMPVVILRCEHEDGRSIRVALKFAEVRMLGFNLVEAVNVAAASAVAAAGRKAAAS